MSDDTQDQTGQELVQSTGGATKELRPGEWPPADVEHHLRRTDTDPKAQARAVRQVATMFMLSVLFVILFIARPPTM